MRNIDACLYVRPSDRTTLERLVADGKTPQKIVARARIVLLSGCGFGTNSIQREARVSKPTVWRWQKAYMDGGVERLLKDRGKGARAGKKPISAEVRLAIVKRTAQEKPKHATHWSARMLAEEIGVGHTTVQRVWKEHGLKPHLTRPFKLSNDPKFAEKVVDIVGLYLNPPDKAVVLCVDEKSQIQALDRTQPGLPMKKGRAQTMTHDYKRNGTTTLFAALDVKTGEVIGECLPRHRAKEFIRFLILLEDDIGFGGPLEGLRFGVALGEPGLDGSLEFGDALEYTAADLLAGDFGEQPLDQVDPGRRCWCEVQLEARMLGEPSLR